MTDPYSEEQFHELKMAGIQTYDSCHRRKAAPAARTQILTNVYLFITSIQRAIVSVEKKSTERRCRRDNLSLFDGVTGCNEWYTPPRRKILE